MSEAAKGYIEDKTITEMFFKSGGRLNRLRYFKRRVVLGILLYVFIYLGYRVIGYEYGQDNNYAATYNTVVSLVFIIPTYFLNVRRLHDMNRGKFLAVLYAILTSIMAFLDFTGVNVMLYVALILATAVFMLSGYMIISPGTNGKNNYGENPI